MNSGSWCAVLALAARMVLPTPAAAAQNPCGSCHEQEKKIEASAHSAVGCAACHPRHESYPHAAGVAKPECGSCHAAVAGEHAASVHGQQLRRGNAAAPGCTVCHGDVHQTVRARSAEFRKSVPDTCGMCHTEIAQQFRASVHGQALEKGVQQAPVCTDCHGEHSIQAPSNAASPVHRSHVRETCGSCHANVRLSRKFGLPSDRIVSFDASFHGLASKAGSQTVANCASCHGVHNLLASSDPKSSIHPKNLAATCGKCHHGAGTRFALGPVHLWPGRTEPKSVAWVRGVYLILIPVLVGLMLLHNFGDWVRKVRLLRFSGLPVTARGAPPIGDPRMYRFERVLHAVLVTSFIVLAWTGFQLQYPDQWWSRPVLAFEARWSVRGVIHRGAAVLFLLAGALHLISLAGSRKLREHWKLLLPRYTDVGEALHSFTYRLGLRADPPLLPRYSYIEKVEYWAVLWGGVVMGLTGLLLWADNLVLSWLPKEVLDFATAMHFYEAVLACLAIVVWHFYGVIFDPDVYPMDTAWLTGRTPRKHESAEAPAAHGTARW